MNTFLFGKTKNTLMFIVKVAVNLSITVVLQYLMGLFGIQLLTGSIVNMMLLINTLFVGLIGSSIIACVTPFIGILLGLSNNIILQIFICVANILFVTSFCLLNKINFKKDLKIISLIKDLISVIVTSVIKYLFMFYITFKLLLPLIMPNVPQVLSITLGVTQLFTALIGGMLYIVISNILKKTLKQI